MAEEDLARAGAHARDIGRLALGAAGDVTGTRTS